MATPTPCCENGRRHPMSDLLTFCPQCGPNVFVNEDGCCRGCGATASGRGVEDLALRLKQGDEALKKAEERAGRLHALQGDYQDAVAERDEARDAYLQAAEAAHKLRDRVDDLKAERDEAVEALRYLMDCLTGCDGPAMANARRVLSARGQEEKP